MRAYASFNPTCRWEPKENWIRVPSSLILPELQFFFRERPAGLEIDYDPNSTTPLKITIKQAFEFANGFVLHYRASTYDNGGKWLREESLPKNFPSDPRKFVSMLDEILANHQEEITLSRIMKPQNAEKFQIGVWYEFVNDNLLLPKGYKISQVESESPEDPFSSSTNQEPKGYHTQFLNLLMEFVGHHKYEGILAGEAEYVHKKNLSRSQVIEEIVHELIPKIKKFAK